jgi:hypothetical protein
MAARVGPPRIAAVDADLLTLDPFNGAHES